MVRHLAVAVCGFVVAALGVAGLDASVAAAACSNEAFRTGPSAQLTECRAYEQVSPVDKESGEGISVYGNSGIAPGGDAVLFGAPSAFDEPDGNPQISHYFASRDSGAWNTTNVSGLQGTKLFFLIFTAYALSPDGDQVLVGSEEAFAPGAITGGSNLYLIDTHTGATTLVIAVPSNNPVKRDWTNVGGAPPITAADSDWSDILISSSRVLAPGAVAGASNLYEYRDGRFRLAFAEAGAAGNQRTPNVMSTDGNRYFYVKEGLIRRHEADGQSILVSQDENGAPAEGAVFRGASPDGQIAYFTFERYLYRFDAAKPTDERVTRIVGNGLGGELPFVDNTLASQTGESIYFNSTARLTPDAEPEGEELLLYVWHESPDGGGEIRYVANGGIFDAALSPNGRYFGFSTEDVHLYDYDRDLLSCPSCAGTSVPSASRLGGAEQRRNVLTGSAYPLPHVVLDNGLILFETPSALLARDVNDVSDAYGWRDGRLQLISTGTDSSPSNVINASADGSDVFFGTRQSLVGQDRDTAVDLYDARIDGGLPQEGPIPPTPCSSETNCRGQVTTGSPSVAPASTAPDDGATCRAFRTRAREATRRSRVLARRAKKAAGKRAKTLGAKAKREARAAEDLGRRAGNCTGGGR